MWPTDSSSHRQTAPCNPRTARMSGLKTILTETFSMPYWRTGAERQDALQSNEPIPIFAITNARLFCRTKGKKVLAVNGSSIFLYSSAIRDKEHQHRHYRPANGIKALVPEIRIYRRPNQRIQPFTVSGYLFVRCNEF